MKPQRRAVSSLSPLLVDWPKILNLKSRNVEISKSDSGLAVLLRLGERNLLSLARAGDSSGILIRVGVDRGIIVATDVEFNSNNSVIVIVEFKLSPLIVDRVIQSRADAIESASSGRQVSTSFNEISNMPNISSNFCRESPSVLISFTEAGMRPVKFSTGKERFKKLPWLYGRFSSSPTSIRI